MIKSTRIRLAGHIAGMGKKSYRVLVEKSEEKKNNHFDNLNIILKWILDK
jgi:hypothetical protein